MEGSGGIAFIYNEEIKANCEFYRNRIAVLQMEKIVIIGVYMTYNNSTQKNQDDYNSDLQLIQEMTENFKKYKKNVIICGDFNTDMSRLDAFTYSLNYLLVYLKYSVADLLWHQDDSINYTFFSKITKNGAQTKTIKSWIDHFLIQQNMQFAIDCKITPMPNNTGDHHPIKLRIKTQENDFLKEDPKILAVKRTRKPKPNWDNVEFRNEYSKRVNKSLLKIKTHFNNIEHEHNCTNPQNMIDELYTQICRSLNEAKNSCENLFTYTRKPKKKCGIKTKDWWDNDLQILFYQMKLAYQNYKQ